MRWTPLIIAAALPAFASAAAAQQAEIEYPEGSLAYQAIVAGDYAAAELKLRGEARIPRNDPARLINHGYVLHRLGRVAEAAKMFEQASRAEEIELVLSDGRTMSSRDVALLALRSVSVGGPDSE